MPAPSSSRFVRLALMATLGASLVSAHMELLFPPPINSRFDKQTIEANIDYSMTSPLNTDGSNYPCKGYNTPEAYSTLKPVATMQAGTDFEVEFAPGGATHEGGSCQFSVSYDQGKTFAVIYSVEGGCPLSPKYSVPVPADLPSGKSATFSWTWFNKVGNREMYQNCAIVDIAGSSATSFTGPALYRANTFADGTCTTVEGVEPVFANPGQVTAYGGSTTKSSRVTSLDNCKLKQDGDVTISPSGNSSPSKSSSSSRSSSPSSAAYSAPRPSSSLVPPVPDLPPATVQSSRIPFKDRTAAVSPSQASGTPARSSSPLPSHSSSSSSPLVWRPVPTVTKTSASTLAPSSPAASSSSSASPTSLQARVTRPPFVRKSTKAPIRTPVRVTTTLTKTAFTTSTATATATATTTVSVSAACSTAPAEPAPTNAPATDEAGSGASATYLQCDTLVTFSLCDSNGCTPMGSVAPGTQCKDGQIVLATATRLIKVRRGAVVGVPLRGGPTSNETVVRTKRSFVHDPRRHS
ncbi:hypothetical protein JCM16303_000029 [Sporobolomyces ruberrimus]